MKFKFEKYFRQNALNLLSKNSYIVPWDYSLQLLSKELRIILLSK